MSWIGETASAMAAIFVRDLRLYRSYRLKFVTQMFATVMSLALFYYVSRLVVRGSGEFASSDDYFAFVVVGIVALRVIVSTLSAPQSRLSEELLAGTFERTAVSGLGPVGGIVALLAFPLALALVTAVVTLGFAVAVFGLDLHWETVPLFLPVATLGALAIAPFGILALAAVLVSKQATAATGFVITGLALVSGLYFPVSLLPDSIRWLSEVQPFAPAAELSRYALLDRDLGHSVWLDLLRLAGFAVVLLLPSLWVLGVAVRHTRRQGTLTEI